MSVKFQHSQLPKHKQTNISRLLNSTFFTENDALRCRRCWQPAAKNTFLWTVDCRNRTLEMQRSHNLCPSANILVEMCVFFIPLSRLKSQKQLLFSKYTENPPSTCRKYTNSALAVRVHCRHCDNTFNIWSYKMSEGCVFVCCWPPLDIIMQRNTHLMHNLSSVYFVKYLYMFRPYLQPIIRRYAVWIQQLVLIFILDDCLLCCWVEQSSVFSWRSAVYCG